MEQKQHDLGSTKLRRDRQNESQAEKGQSILWLRWLIAAVFFILVALLLMALIKCGDQPAATDELPIYLSCPDDNHPHLIDLGLPSGTLWACCNVGSRTPEGFGGYYAWGETAEKSDYQWSTYAYYNSNSNTPMDEAAIIGYDIAGTEYDAATVNWGDQWRMPSSDQSHELIYNCSISWTTRNGVRGQVVKGANGGSIFLPAAGWRHHAVIDSVGVKGGYWLSTCHELHPIYSTRMVLRDTTIVYGLLRYFGQSVRPVSVISAKTVVD